jgi:hypothetical protein
MDTVEMCGGEAGPGICLAGQPFSRQPHNSPGDLLLAPESRGLNQLRLGWRNGKGRFINELPPNRSDVSSYQWIQFRAALDYADARNAGSSGDFSIRLVDGEGGSASVRLGQHSQARHSDVRYRLQSPSIAPARSGPFGTLDRGWHWVTRVEPVGDFLGVAGDHDVCIDPVRNQKILATVASEDQPEPMAGRAIGDQRVQSPESARVLIQEVADVLAHHV